MGPRKSLRLRTNALWFHQFGCFHMWWWKRGLVSTHMQWYRAQNDALLQLMPLLSSPLEHSVCMMNVNEPMRRAKCVTGTATLIIRCKTGSTRALEPLCENHTPQWRIFSSKFTANETQAFDFWEWLPNCQQNQGIFRRRQSGAFFDRK